MIAENGRKLDKKDSKFDMTQYKKEMYEQFPELSDPRCFTHPMREVPVEHLEQLYNSTFLCVDKYEKFV